MLVQPHQEQDEQIERKDEHREGDTCVHDPFVGVDGVNPGDDTKTTDTGNGQTNACRQDECDDCLEHVSPFR